MIPRNKQNRKARVDLRCATCGMQLSDARAEGFVRDGETFCCKGCAEGTGCVCVKQVVVNRRTFNRPGSRGQRNPKNTTGDQNFKGEAATTGARIGWRSASATAPAGMRGRDQSLVDGTKIAPTQQRNRDSTRQQARGRSEFLGSLARRPGNKGHLAARISRTGRKGK